MRKRPIRSGVLQPIGSISFGQMIDLKRRITSKEERLLRLSQKQKEAIPSSETSNKYKKSRGRYEYL